MTTVRSEDLFVVYRSETGRPASISNVDVKNVNAFEMTSGESHVVETTPKNQYLDGTSLTSTGTGLMLDILIELGEIKEVRIVQHGSGYVDNELVTVSGGNGLATLLVSHAGESNGSAEVVSLQNAGGEYKVINGFLKFYEAFADDSEGELLKLLPEVSAGNVIGVSPRGTEFQPYTPGIGSDQYKVGETVYITDIGNDPILEGIISYVTQGPGDAEPGGSFRYEGNQLFSDVQELIDGTTSRLSVTNVDYDATDSTHEFNGHVSFDSATDVITFQRTGTPEYQIDDYGYNFLNGTNEYDTSEVETQAEFNAKVYAKLGFIEDNIYNPVETTKLNNEYPRLVQNTQAKTAIPWRGLPVDHYDIVASKTDIEQLQSLTVGNANEIQDLRNEIAVFETGGLIFKGYLDPNENKTLPNIEDPPETSGLAVGHFYSVAVSYDDPMVGQLQQEDAVAVMEDETGTYGMSYTVLPKTYYDGVFLALAGKTSQSVEGDVALGGELSVVDRVTSKETLATDNNNVLTSKGYVDTLVGDIDLTPYAEKVELNNYSLVDHKHDAADVETGTFVIGRIPVGESDTTVAVGNHTHDSLTTSVDVDSTVTGNPGTNAIVENVGDTVNAKFKFTIPRGAAGTNGTDGRNGSNGSNGSNGTNGKDFKITTGSSTPSSLATGAMFLNTSSNILYIGL